MAWKTSVLGLTCITHHMNYLGEPTILFLQVQHGDNSFSTHLGATSAIIWFNPFLPQELTHQVKHFFLPPLPPFLVKDPSQDLLRTTDLLHRRKYLCVCTLSHTFLHIIFGRITKLLRFIFRKAKLKKKKKAKSKKKKSNPELEKTIVMNQKNF